MHGVGGELRGECERVCEGAAGIKGEKVEGGSWSDQSWGRCGLLGVEAARR